MQNDKSKVKNEFKNRLYAFVLDLIKFVESLPKDGVTKVITDQLVRSGTSVIGNFTEGQSASSKKDFTNYFNHSLKSANESKLWLALLRDAKKANQNRVNLLLDELDEISKILASSILTLKGKKHL